MTAAENTEAVVAKPAPPKESTFDPVELLQQAPKIDTPPVSDTTVAQMPAFATNIYSSVFDANPTGDANRLLGSIPRNSAELFQQFGRVTDAKALNDKVDPTKDWALGNDNPGLLKSRKDVMELAQSRGLDMNTFATSMRQLEERAQKKETNAGEVQSTYDNVARLLRNDGNSQLSKSDMNRLASQIMKHAGEPSSVYQGNYNTCSVAATEVRTYARTPGAAAKLVADVAEKGFFRSPLDGTRVDIDRKPHGESLLPENDKIRTHASEIFQVTASNLFWTDKGKQYTQINPRQDGGYQDQPGGPQRNPTDNGERLVDKKTGRPVEGGDEHFPSVPDDGYAKIVSRITGKPETHVAIQRTESLDGPAPSVLQPKTPQQFEQMLTQLKKQGKLPIMAGVDTNFEPFKGDGALSSTSANAVTEEEGPHQVLIRDFIPAADGKPARILVDNTWSRSVDRLNPNLDPSPGKDGRIPQGAALTVEQMFTAMGEWKKPKK